MPSARAAQPSSPPRPEAWRGDPPHCPILKKQIVINASQDRSRIAIVEDGELVELYVENPDNVRTIGNIYLGKVEKVMPTLRAAFVDIGEKQDAFLHFSDLTDNFPQLLKMSGEDVPGLEEPMLALAPQKRIADDESEPDVEDTLEVESAQDDDESPSRSRSTRRRRSRGRGRTSQAGSEEEEQEEQGKRPRGPLVLDFTSKPKPRAAAPEPRAKAPAPAAERPAAEAPAATPPVADKADASETPAEAPRSRRAPRTAADLPPPETEDAAPETAEETKKPRRSRAKKTQDAPAETQAIEAETPPADEKSEPRSRRSRGQKAEETVEVPTETADAAAVDAAPADAAPADAETAARPRRAPRNRPTRATTATVTAEARVAPAAETPEAAETLAAETPAEDGEREDRTRSRRRTRGAADTPEQTPEPTAEKAEKAEAPLTSEPTTPEAPKRPRGMAVLDLTSGARPKPAPRPEPVRPEPVRSEPAAEADDDEAPRSRRPARSRDADAPDTVSTEPIPEADETAEDRPRSRRRGRRSEEDSRPTDRDETPRAETRRDEPAADTDDDEADEAPARSRRQTRETSGRGDSGRETSGREPSSKSDAGRDGRGRRDEAKPGASRAPGARRVPVPSNEQLLRRDGHVIVKITKEPISAKGSRVSTDISLAGRFLVLVPAADYVAVSKKIESAKERRRLRTLAQSLKPDNCGVIVRTVAEGRDAKSLDTDLRLLIDKWRSIEAKLDGGKAKAPILLYEDVNMVSSIVRDLFSEDFDRILVDDPKVFKNVQAYVKAVAPDMADKVELHRGSAPAFRSVGIEKQVEEAFSRRVNMKGGGYLFIETTEAMHVVDVNSGRAGRGKSQKENMIAVNVEAAREVAKQLRLRDLGGIIVVDFIDLRLEADRRKVTNVLKEAFEKDRAVTKLLPMSDFGLVQITRQRLRPSITAQPEGDEPGGDPAERAARAGAGEIEQAPGRRARGDDRRDDGRDERPSRELDTIGEAPAETRDRNEREPRNDREPRGDRGDRSDRGRRSTRDTARETPRAPRDAAEERPEPAASPESATALLRAWLDVYRKAVEEPYRDRPVVVRVHPLFLTHLQRGLFSTLTRWRLSVRNIPWRIEEDAALDPLAFDVRDEKSGRSLLRKYAL